MHIILGGTGHVGSAAARRLLALGEPVTVVSHGADKRADWERLGARFEVVDALDADALRAVFRQGRSALLLNPPADVSGDVDAQERRSVAAMLQALAGSGLRHVVAESTMGAQPGEHLGDLGVLYELEQGLRRQPIPASIVRAAYYMSNWDASLPAIRATGRLQTMLPADLAIPMVAPQDLGHAVARLLTGPPPAGEPVIHPVEGPRRHSLSDVAAAFAAALGKPVQVVVTPRSEWRAAYRKLGFSEAAADSFARMTAASIDGGFDRPASTEHGTVTLADYVQDLVQRG
ncbi:MAG: NmrA family NAD(P)-binding protein [Burkholderiaceae bacterium]